jgi:hypothetical protein
MNPFLKKFLVIAFAFELLAMLFIGFDFAQLAALGIVHFMGGLALAVLGFFVALPRTSREWGRAAMLVGGVMTLISISICSYSDWNWN